MRQHLMPAWGLGGAEAGMMASVLAFGYMFAVPFLTGLNDRIDACNVLLVGSIGSALVTLAFGLFANGLWSATLIWGLVGVGFAGAYMPGLKALTDRLPPGDVSRSVTLYTSCFSVGVGLSFLVSQVVADNFGWRWAFVASGCGPFLMVAAFLAMPAVKPLPTEDRLLDFRPVLHNRLLGYSLPCRRAVGRCIVCSCWPAALARNLTHSSQSRP